jgi:hypothetical protein
MSGFSQLLNGAFLMYSGIVLFCNKASQQQCLSRRLYTCADKKTKLLAKFCREQ